MELNKNVVYSRVSAQHVFVVCVCVDERRGGGGGAAIQAFSGLALMMRRSCCTY
jgi:hypothetical protein